LKRAQSDRTTGKDQFSSKKEQGLLVTEDSSLNKISFAIGCPVLNPVTVLKAILGIKAKGPRMLEA
jgi:hypothetical protein